MSIGSISSTAAATFDPAAQKSPPPKSAPGEMPADKISISPEAHKAAAAASADKDHDGDAR